jgi:hypothetical protein
MPGFSAIPPTQKKHPGRNGQYTGAVHPQLKCTGKKINFFSFVGWVQALFLDEKRPAYGALLQNQQFNE